MGEDDGKAGGGEIAGGLQRIYVVADLPAVIALFQSHDLPRAEVDAGEDFQWHEGQR